MVFIRCISLIGSRSNIRFQFSANIVKPIECEVKSAKNSAKQHKGRCCNGSDYANRIGSHYDIPITFTRNALGLYQHILGDIQDGL